MNAENARAERIQREIVRKQREREIAKKMKQISLNKQDSIMKHLEEGKKHYTDNRQSKTQSQSTQKAPDIIVATNKLERIDPARPE